MPPGLLRNSDSSKRGKAQMNNYKNIPFAKRHKLASKGEQKFTTQMIGRAYVSFSERRVHAKSPRGERTGLKLQLCQRRRGRRRGRRKGGAMTDLKCHKK